MGNSQNRKRKSNIFLIIAILLLIAGIALLLVDPIKNYIRKTKIQQGIDSIEEQISQHNEDSEEIVEMTFIVPVNGNEVEGEDYDYFTDDEEEIERQREAIEAELEAMGNEMTLTAIGILEIDSIELQVPVWDDANVVSLRYGVGHFDTSVLPGEEGNCAILGHHMRAYGSIFNRLEEVVVGDNVRVRSVDGHIYNYEIDEIIVVSASVLDEYLEGDIYDDARITLVTCTYTAQGTQRLLVMGHLVE